MKRSLRLCMTGNDGATAVEFALVIPIFLLFLLGLFEFGHYYYVRDNLQYAADEAGRYVIVSPTASNSAVQTRVRDNITAVNDNEVTVTVSDQTIGGIEYKNISVSYSFTLAPGRFIGIETIPITVQSSVPLLE